MPNLKCQYCGHPNHESKMHQDVCTFYVAALGAECGCRILCKRCGYPHSMHRPEKLAHHSECTLEQFEGAKSGDKDA